MTKEQMAAKIQLFMSDRGGYPHDWYVGITKNIRSRLFGDHKVPVNEDVWIYVDGNDDSDARAVEAYFLELGCEGGPGGGDHESRFVYAYQRTPQTFP